MSIYLKANFWQAELGEHKGGRVFFLDQDKPNQGRKVKKLMSKAKGKCSGESDWLMADSVQWVEWFAGITSPPRKKSWRSSLNWLRLADCCPMTIEYHIKGLAKKLISLG